MRLAREYERAEGRDLRGFLAYAAGQDLAEAREGEAALESEGLDAVRLMTIHRAKGLEFPVVCVADLGRPGATGRERLLIGPDGGAGLKLATLAGGDPVPALGYERDRRRARRRGVGRGAAAALRRRDARRGAADPVRRDRHREVAGPAPGRPAARLARAGAAGRPRRRAAARSADRRRRALRRGRGRRAARHRRDAAAGGDGARAARAAPAAPGTALPAEPKVIPAGGRPQPAQRRLSYSSLQDYARCPYRFYLGRVLGLPRVERAAAGRGRRSVAAPSPRRSRGGSAARWSTSCSSGSTSPGPRRPAPTRCWRSPRRTGSSSSPRRSRTSAPRSRPSPRSPLCARLAAARGVRREAGFAFALEPDGGGPLVNGFIDVAGARGRRHRRSSSTTRPTGWTRTTRRRRSSSARTRPSARSTRSPRSRTARRASRSPTRCSSGPPSRSSATFGQADAPALADALLGLADGVLAEAWPVAERPHRELCGECPGRATLCSWPEAMTLRPPEEVYADSAGTLAGSGGPS